MPASKDSPKTPKRAEDSSPTAALRPFPRPFRFKRVFVPLDGTFYAERALPYATMLARLTGASMTLAHVSAPPLPSPARTAKRVAENLVGRDHEPHVEDVTIYLEAQRVLQAFHAPDVDTETVEDDDAVFGLRQMAERAHADTLVLATHARQGVERQVLGSTADGLVEQSHLPLLVIPPQAVVPAEAPSFREVLVPLDGSQVAEYALSVLLGLIQTTARTTTRATTREGAAEWALPHWHITLFTVMESRSLRADSRAYLDEIEARLKATDLPEGVRISKRVRLGSAPGAIVAMADHGRQSPDVMAAPFDLVVMATHGRGGLGAWLYGSVARYVLPRVSVPVLLVHPTDASV